MSAIDDSVAAYPDRKQGWLAALWADKARLRRLLMIWGVAAFLAIAAVVYLVGGRYVGSDDAYVHANKLMVSTDVSGLVQSVDVHEGQQVKKGDVLFTLDPKPFEIALENAKANLASTVQDVESTRAQYRAVVGQIAAQQAQLNVNQQTYARYQALAKQNAIAAMQVDTQHAAQFGALVEQVVRPDDAARHAADQRPQHDGVGVLMCAYVEDGDNRAEDTEHKDTYHKRRHGHSPLPQAPIERSPQAISQSRSRPGERRIYESGQRAARLTTRNS